MAFKKIQEPAKPFESVLRTTCGNCPAGCGMKVFLVGGKVVDIFGDEEHPINKGSLCPKGLLSYFQLNHPSRLTQPRVRESLQKPFQTVSWEDAVEFVAGRLRPVAKSNGQESVVVFGTETDPFDYLAGAARFASEFKTPFTPERFFPAPWGENGLIAKMFGVPAAQLQTNPPRDWCNSRCILLYCCDLAASDTITFGPILDARDRGAALLTIDTKTTVTSSKATMSLRVRPGTQSVLLKGILRLMISRELVHPEFIAEATEGLGDLNPEVESYTSEKVCDICGIASAELERFVEYLGKSPVQVIAGDWSSRKFLSDTDLCGCAAIACLKGSIGIPGGGVNFLGVSPFAFTEHQGNGKGETSVALEQLLMDRPGGIAALFWHGNPRAGLTGGKVTREALDKVPLIVHLSSYPNETCEHAHVSLPMSSWLEYDGLLATSDSRAVQIHKKVVDPPGECRSPLEFWTALAGALGLSLFEGALFEGGKEKVYDSLLKQNPLTAAMSFAGLDPNTELPGGVLWPCTESSQLQFESSRFVKGTTRGFNILFQKNRSYLDSGRRFPTASGKIVFPKFSGNGAGADSDNARNFPLLLTTGVRVDYVEEYAGFRPDDTLSNEPAVKINPQLARSLDIKKDDLLIVAGAAGQVEARASVSDDVAPGVIWLPLGAGHETGDSGPMSLFDLPSEGNTPSSYARVTLFKSGADREASAARITAFLGSEA
jgi:anaerobic selenocysteine-containing dehydrogenase